MKKFLLILTICLLALTSCTSNKPVESESDDSMLDSQIQSSEEKEESSQDIDFEPDTQDVESDDETASVAGSSEKNVEADTAKVTSIEADTEKANEEITEKATEIITEEATETKAEPVTEKETETVTESVSDQIITEAETTAVESEPIQTEVVDKAGEATVVDAVAYSRDITLNSLMSRDSTIFTHYVYIPMITLSTGNTDAINKFNAQIYDKFIFLKEELEAGNINSDWEGDPSIDGDKYHFQLEYDSSVKSNVVAILMKLCVAALPGGGTNYEWMYYYDVDADREITFDEYLERLNIDKDKLNKMALEQEHLDSSHFYVKDALVSDGEITAVFNSSFEMMRSTTLLICSPSDLAR